MRKSIIVIVFFIAVVQVHGQERWTNYFNQNDNNDVNVVHVDGNYLWAGTGDCKMEH